MVVVIAQARASGVRTRPVGAGGREEEEEENEMRAGRDCASAKEESLESVREIGKVRG